MVEFGSTMLGVETAQSDLDLLVTSFDCLIDRNKFFNEIECVLKTCPLVKQLVVIRNCNVPLAKFKFDGVKVDLVFAEMKTPKEIFLSAGKSLPTVLSDPDYLLLESSLNQSNLKGADCINSYLSTQRLKLFV
jgi:poly(A) polymerase Pap1